MKQILIFIAFCLVLTMMGCFGSSDSGGSSLDGMSTSELITSGWNAFTASDFNNAERYFNALTTREDGYLVGHYGLGWTFIRKHDYVNARSEFVKFTTTDSLGVYTQSDIVFINVRAGQTIAAHVLSEHANAIAFSNAIPATWVFAHDTRLDITDIRLFRAYSQCAVNSFPAALTTVRLIDPTFESDVNTVEGRIRLMERIEQLFISRNWN
jgi:hypothetical protein